MSREIRRVPMNHGLVEIGKTWTGYFMPEKLRAPQCPGIADGVCDNGATYAAAWVMAMARLLLQLDDDLTAQARGNAMHPYFKGMLGYGLGPGVDGVGRPSPDIREFGTGLAGRASGFIGHDAIDSWTAYRKLTEAAGLPEGWGQCPICKGRAVVEAYPGQEAEAEAWEPPTFPVGDAWQLWQTTTEGGPVSPTYENPEGLAEWMRENGWEHLTPEDTLNWVKAEGSSFGTMIGTNGHVIDGVTAAVTMKKGN